MTTCDDEVRLADGRLLRIQDAGATDAPQPSFLPRHARIPAAARPLAGRGRRCWPAAARLDRPGCGGSSAQPDRTVAEAATDVAALADQLQVDRFAVWTVSGGGPHALACAALWPTGWWRPRSSRPWHPMTPRGWTGLRAWRRRMFSGSSWRWPAGGVGAGAGPVGPGVATDPAQLIALSGSLLSPPNQAVAPTSYADSFRARCQPPGWEGRRGSPATASCSLRRACWMLASSSPERWRRSWPGGVGLAGGWASHAPGW
jgi:pimeloyl-ACP methyl ester carboxylesterase